MSNYWLGDTAGRVLGPLTLQALRELIASGRMRAVTRASRDGNTWVPLPEFDEVKDILAAQRGPPPFEVQQAERLRVQLRGLQALQTPHEVFGLKPQASLDEVRLAFFRMARRFSPEHLGPDAHPDLRNISSAIFEFLSQKMREAETQAARGSGSPHTPPPILGFTPMPPPVLGTYPTPPPVRGASPAHPPPRPAARSTPTPPPLPRGSPARPAPTYASEEFVGLVRRSEDRMLATVRVTPQSVGMFMDHPLVNLATGGLFVPTHRPLRLGTQVDLSLSFEQPPRTIELRSAVIWENALDDGRQPQGYGLRLSELRKEERAFLQEFVRAHHRRH